MAHDKDRDDGVYIRHINDAIGFIEDFIKDISWESFLKNKLVQNGVVRELEVIGEAVSNISADFKNAHIAIPWQDIIDMRNKLIHEYFGVDLEIVWKTAQKSIPELKKELFRLPDYDGSAH